MRQEINLVTAPATHSMHYMCQRSRIYSGHLCSTGVEKGKKNRLCYNELGSLSPAKNNAHAWADRDCHPSRQQGVALQDVSVQDSQFCVLCTLPSSAVCTESPAPCAAHPSHSHHHAVPTLHRSTSCCPTHPIPWENSSCSSLLLLDRPLWLSFILHKLLFFLQKCPEESDQCPTWLCSCRATNSSDLNRAMRRKKGRGRRAQQARAMGETRAGFKAITVLSDKGGEIIYKFLGVASSSFFSFVCP